MIRVQSRIARLSVALIVVLTPATFYGFPSVYPTGTTIYQPDKAWNGYTIFPTPEAQGAVLIDMNGNLIRRFKEVPGAPVRMLPGGYIMGGSAMGGGAMGAGAMGGGMGGMGGMGGGASALVQLDWEGMKSGASTRPSKSRAQGELPCGLRATTTIGSARAARPATTRRVANHL